MSRIGQMDEKYADMLYMEHHVSKVHPQMPMESRAAQFSPFSALTGYDASLSETARLTDEKIELDESEFEKIDRKLQYLSNHLTDKIIVELIYFKPDDIKSGGKYITDKGIIQKIHKFEKLVQINGKLVPIDDIYSIEFEQIY